MTRAILVGVIAAVSLAACGAGSSRHSPGRLTHAQLISRADALCGVGNQRVEALPRSYGTSLSPPIVAQGTAAIVAIAKPITHQLSELVPPLADATLWDQFITLTEHQLNDSIAVERAARTGNENAIQAAERLATDDNPDPDGYKLGMHVCTLDPVPGGGAVPGLRTPEPLPPSGGTTTGGAFA